MNFKKSLFLFVISLSASISFGTVIISCQDIGNHVVQLSYDSTSESCLVRAFALNVHVSNGVFQSIGNYLQGESTALNPGYGIYPGFLIIPGRPVTYGDPIDTSPGALGGLGTNGVTLDFGAMYLNPEDAPLKTGVLCTLTVSQNCTVSIAPENTYRGGVILENGTQPQVNCYGCQVIPEPATISIIGFGLALLRRKKM